VLAEASESSPVDMAAIYGPNSSRPSTPPMASSLTKILLPHVHPKGHNHIIHHREDTFFFFLFFFFTLLPTWAVCEIPSPHRTLCRHPAHMACHYNYQHSLSTRHASSAPPLQERMGSRDKLKPSVISTRGDTYLSSI
jgi:hypothetical protein